MLYGWQYIHYSKKYIHFCIILFSLVPLEATSVCSNILSTAATIHFPLGFIKVLYRTSSIYCAFNEGRHIVVGFIYVNVDTTPPCKNIHK